MVRLQGWDTARAHWVGNSNGSTVCTYLALRYPQWIKSCVNIAFVVGMLLPEDMKGMLGITCAWVKEGDDPEQHKAALIDLIMTTLSKHATPKMRAIVAKAIEENDWTRRMFFLDLLILGRLRTLPAIEGLSVPTMILQGADDFSWISHAIAAGRRVPHMRVRYVPDVAHIPVVENPGQTVSMVLDFVRCASAGGGLEPPAPDTPAASAR